MFQYQNVVLFQVRLAIIISIHTLAKMALLHWNGTLVLTHLPLDKMAAILADDIFKCIFMNEKFRILIRNSLKFVPNGPINNIPALVQIMAWRRSVDKPLSQSVPTQFTDAYMRHWGDDFNFKLKDHNQFNTVLPR